MTTPPAPGAWPGLLARYRDLLPTIAPGTRLVTLLEGNTPLVPSERLARRLGEGVRLYFKLEGANPTGSFKDRGMTAAVTQAAAAGAQALLCASTGNTSASMAAYAARAGMRAVMLVPDGYVAAGKLAQAVAYGALVVPIRGNFDVALDLVRRLGETEPLAVVNSINPDRIEGQKCAAFEVVDQLGAAPDVLALPVGNAGNITAYWRGFKEYAAAGRAAGTPAMWGFQAAGAAPFVAGHPIEHPETIATAIRIGAPASWDGAQAALAESGGRIRALTDDAILEAYRLLAREEGVFCEPASAASVAGVLAEGAAGRIPPGATIVCVLTGNGLKDPDTARAANPFAWEPVEPELAAIARRIGL